MTLQEREAAANEVLNATLTEIAQRYGLILHAGTRVNKHGEQVQIEPTIGFAVLPDWKPPETNHAEET